MKTNHYRAGPKVALFATLIGLATAIGGPVNGNSTTSSTAAPPGLPALAIPKDAVDHVISYAPGADAAAIPEGGFGYGAELAVADIANSTSGQTVAISGISASNYTSPIGAPADANTASTMATPAPAAPNVINPSPPITTVAIIVPEYRATKSAATAIASAIPEGGLGYGPDLATAAGVITV